MHKGVKSRYAIHKILKLIKRNSISFDEAFLISTKNDMYIDTDINLIHSVVLNSMRNIFIINPVIKKYTLNKKINEDTHLLLLSALTQILILNFKEFAVVNTTVELSKIKKINVSFNFINAVLRNILRNKKDINIVHSYTNLPTWFRKETTKLNIIQKKSFLENIINEPHLHIVFKSSQIIKKSKITGIKTTDISLALKIKTNIKNLAKYNSGDWWVQDFSSMLPIYLTNNLKNKKVADLCSAPGGKTFQLLSKGANVYAYEKNSSRIKIMKNNLQRLNYKCDIINCDILKYSFKQKFDLIILDAPCSAVGTVRRNPEIFFRNSIINFKYFIEIQNKMLEKAKSLLKKNGILIYIVCSFLKKEGEDQILNFLKKNKNFGVIKFETNSNLNKLIDKNGFFLTLPTNLDNGIFIDGFFAAKLIKYD